MDIDLTWLDKRVIHLLKADPETVYTPAAVRRELNHPDEDHIRESLKKLREARILRKDGRMYYGISKTHPHYAGI